MSAIARISSIISLSVMLVSCGGGGGGSAAPSPPPQPPAPPPPPAAGAPTATVDVGIKQLVFSWTEVTGSTHYKLLENADGNSGFTQVGADIAAGTLTVRLPISVHFQDFARALYIVQACDAAGCTDSSEVNAMSGMLSAIGYFKASNPDEFDHFGSAISLSADGRTLAVGTTSEESNATGINGNQNDNSQFAAGAVYVFRFDGMGWAQQAYVKASNTAFGGWFGKDVSLSEDGNTLAVGAPFEVSGATGINGDQNNDLARGSGAAYLFRYDGTNWMQEAYIKASNPDEFDNFGSAISLSADGNTLAVGADGEGSNATGVNADQSDNSASQAGAAYIFRFDGADWSQQSYIKASNTDADDRFGGVVMLGADGNTLAVAAIGEDSVATGVNGDESDNSVGAIGLSAGAMYVFRFNGTDWSQQAYIKASNTDLADAGGNADKFGFSAALSADGNTLAVGAIGEDSSASGLGGNQGDNSVGNSGAAYVFHFDSSDWTQQAYVKASNTGVGDEFGYAMSLSADGNTLAVGAIGEDSIATGVGGNQSDDTEIFAGAAYVFRLNGADWVQRAYVKASNTRETPFGHTAVFGEAVSLDADGNTLAVGATGEDSNATGVGGDQNNESTRASGAAYMY